jgi:predicted RNase H-like HicB family nuclease
MTRKANRGREPFQYSIVLQWSDEDDAYIALVPEFPHASAFGDTPEQAVREMKIAVGLILESMAEDGTPAPEPRKIKPYSGELRVRFPIDLHARLAALAEQEGMSLNSYIVYLLTRASTVVEVSGEAPRPAAAIKRKQAAHRRLARTG